MGLDCFQFWGNFFLQCVYFQLANSHQTNIYKTGCIEHRFEAWGSLRPESDSCHRTKLLSIFYPLPAWNIDKSIVDEFHLLSMFILSMCLLHLLGPSRSPNDTHRFHYTKYPMHVFNFYYLRYGQLTPFQRWFDSMVELHKGGFFFWDSVHNAVSWYGSVKFKRGETPHQGLFLVVPPDVLSSVLMKRSYNIFSEGSVAWGISA